MKRREDAFSLVEVAVAVGIAAFALIAIFGLLPVGIGSNATSIQQTLAVNLATAMVADLREVSGEGSSLSPQYGIDVDQSSPQILYVDESGTQLPQNDARFKVTISLAPPAAGTRNATCGNISIAWPAGSDSPMGSVSVFVALDRN